MMIHRLTITLLVAGLLVALLASCQTPIVRPPIRITLVLPESFQGDLFVVSGSQSDPRCDGEITVPANGIVYISNFTEVSSIPRKSFSAVTTGGKVVSSSLHVDAVGPRLLWPIGKMEGALLYFVVGSLDDKIRLSAAKERKWPEIIRELRAGKP